MPPRSFDFIPLETEPSETEQVLPTAEDEEEDFDHSLNDATFNVQALFVNQPIFFGPEPELPVSRRPTNPYMLIPAISTGPYAFRWAETPLSMTSFHFRGPNTLSMPINSVPLPGVPAQCVMAYVADQLAVFLGRPAPPTSSRWEFHSSTWPFVRAFLQEFPNSFCHTRVWLKMIATDIATLYRDDPDWIYAHTLEFSAILPPRAPGYNRPGYAPWTDLLNRLYTDLEYREFDFTDMTTRYIFEMDFLIQFASAELPPSFTPGLFPVQSIYDGSDPNHHPISPFSPGI